MLTARGRLCASSGQAKLPKLKADFLDMERRWLFLARSYELTERVSAFSAKSNHPAKRH
jgi:hypothetical protein